MTNETAYPLIPDVCLRFVKWRIPLVWVDYRYWNQHEDKASRDSSLQHCLGPITKVLKLFADSPTAPPCIIVVHTFDEQQPEADVQILSIRKCIEPWRNDILAWLHLSDKHHLPLVIAASCKAVQDHLLPRDFIKDGHRLVESVLMTERDWLERAAEWCGDLEERRETLLRMFRGSTAQL